MRKIKFSKGEYFHIYNRGVEKRIVFLDEADYFRFLLGMREFNDTKPIFNLHRLGDEFKMARNLTEPKEPMVEFICYTLMPNHYHFLLRQIKDKGISKFMQKLGTSYTKYFNKRYERTGVLFQGVFKAKRVSDNEHILHLSRYIHLNALSLIQPDWLKNGLKDKDKACKFLKKYKWHSLPYWIDKKPCLIRLNPEIILGQFASLKDYEDFLKDWLEEDFDKIRDIVIEEVD